MIERAWCERSLLPGSLLSGSPFPVPRAAAVSGPEILFGRHPPLESR